MSRTVRALYPFHEDTMRKIRENISKVNEILQQAVSSVLMYVYGDASAADESAWHWTVAGLAASSMLSWCLVRHIT